MPFWKSNGGGSDYADPSATWVTITDGAHVGDGLLTITYVPPAPTIFWGNYDGNTIGFARLDGSCGGALFNTSPVTPNTPDGLAIDSKTGRLYWANYGNGSGTTISFASLAGGKGGNLKAPGATFSGPAGPVIDPATGKISTGPTSPTARSSTQN